MLKFEERIRIGMLSNLHNVYIRVLDFWFESEKVYEENEEILYLLNRINYNNQYCLSHHLLVRIRRFF